MPDQPHKTRRIKRLAIALLVVFVLVFFLPFLTKPQEAKAFPGEALAAAVWRYVKDKIDKAITVARKGAVDLAFKNALKVYLTKVAEDTAVWLASAGTGQKPLFVTDPHYWTNLSDAAAGDFLDTLSTNTFGINVCKPLDPRKQFSVESAVRALVDPANACQNECKREYTAAQTTDGPQIGPPIDLSLTLPDAEDILGQFRAAIAGGVDPTKPALDAGEPFSTFCDGPITASECLSIYERDIQTYKFTIDKDYKVCLNLCSANKRVARCTLSQIGENIDKAKNSSLLPKLTKYFEPGENDIGQILTLSEKAQNAATKAEQEARDAQNAKVQPLKDPVTGEIKTPAPITEEAAKAGLSPENSGKAYEVYTGSPVADAIGVFTNTLTKRLLKRIFERGLNPGAEPGTSFSNITGGVSGVQAARMEFASLAQPDFKSGGSSVSLDELSACPDSDPSQNNCVLDEGFRQAIEEGLTVKEAIDTGFLDAKKPLGYKSISPSVEPDFREGYPYRSLLILRRLRIIPVGWELAAQTARTTKIVTLSDAVAGYDQCDQAKGTWTPLCGLVDPNWVLKAPLTYCKVSGATAALTSQDYFPDPLFPDAPQVRQIGRANSCVDEQSCLQEDENGNCLSYGYCVQERPSWKFGGQRCDGYFHSCDTFTDPAGVEVSYLKNTLDYEQCTATNAGCQWYCMNYDPGKADFTCEPVASGDAKNRAYYTAKVATCDASAEGCREYIRTGNNSNLTANGGFETFVGTADDGIADSFLGWQASGIVTKAVSGANSGAVAAEINGSAGQQFKASFDTGFFPNGQDYTLSFYGKGASGACSGTFGIQGTEKPAIPYFKSEPVTYTNAWQRYTTTLHFDASKAYANNIVTVFFETNGCSALLDDVQLENGGTFSSYKDYGSTNKIYLGKSRLSCRQEEVGCDLYTSATDKIPGVATAEDSCSKDQVGCRAFLEVPITDNGTDPTVAQRTGKRCDNDQSKSCATSAECGGGACLPSVSLIPSTGRVCSAADVGCEEFTNLDEVARGGEGKEYYTYIRECRKPPDPNQKTFYTWLGSETTGFQLKAYNLVKDGGGGPAYIAGFPAAEAAKCNATTFNNTSSPDYSADCRQFYDASLNIFYRFYAKTISISDDCHPLRNTIDGVIYSAVPSEGTTCPASSFQCREYRGPAGYNTRTILSDTFDDGDTAGWTGGTASAESLSFGGSSMRVPSAVQTSGGNIPNQLHQGRSYIVSFWAGAASSGDKTLTVSFAGGTETFAGTAVTKWDSTAGSGSPPPGGPLWKFYTLGPLNLDRSVDTDPAGVDGDPTDELQFTGTGAFYLDNIKLTEVSDNVYLIKDTAKLCKGNENCDRYTNRAGKEFFLKGFTRLCSQEKVGCEAVIDTYNSDYPFSKDYNNGSHPSGSGNLNVPGDSIALLVNDPKAYCSAEQQGCTLYGQPTFGTRGEYCKNKPAQACSTSSTSPISCPAGTGPCVASDVTIAKYDAAYLLNDPDQYDSTLCKSGEVGCNAWTNKRTNETAYFRDPVPRTCEYRTDVIIEGVKMPDWYKTGTSGLDVLNDVCKVKSPAPQPAGTVFPLSPYTQPAGTCSNSPSTYCQADADCGSGDCILWGGICPTAQAGCKEYRDITDPSACYSNCLMTVDQNSGDPVKVNADCSVDTSGVGTNNGCRGYWYLEQTVASNATECNGSVDDDLGCRAFFSPDQ